MSRKRQDRIFKTVIALLCLCAAGLVAAIALQSRMNRLPGDALQTLSDASGATPEPMTVVSADSQLNQADPKPTEAATAEPEPESTEMPFEYLPVYTGIETSEKVIAITLDDCSDLASLKYAATAASEYGAKLTLLPVAMNVLAEENRTALQYCVFTLGYQVENRTLNNNALYTLNDFELANEIWTADMAIDYALNMDYGMHLLRTRGGQGTQDIRTHTYLKQLGYDGFLNWSVESTRYTADELKSYIQPGAIYLFNCTKDEVVKLAEFMKFAENLGYRMVTVNELLGFAENSCTTPQDDILARTIVELEGFDDTNMEYADGDRSYGVYKLQKMLFEMGYLTDGTSIEELASMQYMDYIAIQQKMVDGVFGGSTRSAIMTFQSERGLPCTGVATLEIQKMIRDEYAYRTGQ